MKWRALALAFAASAFLNGVASAKPDDLASARAPWASNSDRLLEWVQASGDNNGMPFAIVDKVAAAIFVHDAGGRLLGAEPVLLGSALGDDSAPHIGDRELAAIRPEERTTPAGRFIASYGPSRGQGNVLWVDYATAISLHAVPTGKKKERRLERLQSAPPDDNRISYGCINVSASFYENVIREAFKDARGVVYVLPDTKPLAEVLPSFAVYTRVRSGLE